MKKLTLCFRGFFALFLLIGLASCGGYTTVDLGGKVTGLTNVIDATKPALVLLNGNDTVGIPVGATSYKFPNQIGITSSYAVTPQSPTNTANTCILSNQTGTASGINITNVNVTCGFKLGGTITGLTSTGLVLTNGFSTVSPLPTDPTFPTFTLPIPVAQGTSYTVAVSVQPTTPTTQTCTVDPTTATGVMGSADVSSVIVNCI